MSADHSKMKISRESNKKKKREKILCDKFSTGHKYFDNLFPPLLNLSLVHGRRRGQRRIEEKWAREFTAAAARARARWKKRGTWSTSCELISRGRENYLVLVREMRLSARLAFAVVQWTIERSGRLEGGKQPRRNRTNNVKKKKNHWFRSLLIGEKKKCWI